MIIVPDSPPDGEGERRRDAALALLCASRATLVRTLTRAVARLALDRNELTADDLRAVVPIPSGIRPVVVGAAMRGAAVAGIIKPTGVSRRSRRPEAHARQVAVWRLNDPDRAAAWLAAHPDLTAPTGPGEEYHE